MSLSDYSFESNPLPLPLHALFLTFELWLLALAFPQLPHQQHPKRGKIVSAVT